MVMLVAVLKVPAAHGVHVRSCAALPARLAYVPAAQFDHGVQVVALGVAVKLPAVQSLHTRFTSGVPTALTYIPAPQAVHGTHGLAGFAS
jgi:hypothetical protein